MANQYKLQDIIDLAAQLEYLQAVLEEFDTTAISLNKLLTWYFQDGLKASIRAQLDKRDWNIADWQETIEWAIDAKAKINW